jgi:excinuclease ABC subunit B
MKKAIETTEYRRKKQEEYNKKHGITPKTTKRDLDENLRLEDYSEVGAKKIKDKIPPKEKQKIIQGLKAKMLEAAKKLEFEVAAKLRDEIEKIKKL